jgi:hypothetical protein
MHLSTRTYAGAILCRACGIRLLRKHKAALSFNGLLRRKTLVLNTMRQDPS